MSQRDRLLNRKRPTATYDVMVDDDTEARKELEEAETALEIAQMGPQDDDAKAEVKKARDRVEEAKKALAACYETIVMQAVKPERWEDLVKEHPGREGKKEPYNPDTFPMALFLECVQSDMTPEDWETFLTDQVSWGERDSSEGLLLTCLLLNGRAPTGIVPKD